MYSTSVFEFPDALREWFDWRVLPQRLDFVKALVLHSGFNDHQPFREYWESYWSRVAQLQGLRYLYASIVYSFDVTEGGVERLLEPLMKVRQVKDFKVALIWPPGDSTPRSIEAPENAPFELTTIADDVYEARRPRHAGWNMDPNTAMDMLEKWIPQTLRSL
jgi:hypothetical protein